MNNKRRSMELRCPESCIISTKGAGIDCSTSGGTNTTGPDATHNPAICQNWGGGFGRWVVPKVGGGGGVRATHYYHMHTSRGDVCLRFGGMEVCM